MQNKKNITIPGKKIKMDVFQNVGSAHIKECEINKI
jgi:hypothetical protein